VCLCVSIGLYVNVIQPNVQCITSYISSYVYTFVFTAESANLFLPLTVAYRLLDICLHVNTIYVQSLHINIVICIQI